MCKHYSSIIIEMKSIVQQRMKTQRKYMTLYKICTYAVNINFLRILNQIITNRVAHYSLTFSAVVEVKYLNCKFQ